MDNVKLLTELKDGFTRVEQEILRRIAWDKTIKWDDKSPFAIDSAIMNQVSDRYDDDFMGINWKEFTRKVCDALEKESLKN